MMESMSTEKRTSHEALIGRSKQSADGGRGFPGHRRGAAGFAWLVVLALVIVVLGAVTWNGMVADESGGDFELADRKSTEAPAQPLSTDLAEAAEGPRVMTGVEAGPAGAYASMDRVFEGTGMILGEVRVEQGVPYPERWTLKLEPSRVAPGRQKAITRTITSEPGQRDFQLRDLPMAAYRLSVEAEGLVARPQEVALYKLAGYEHMPGLNVVNVTSRLVQMASVSGRVRQADGDMAVDFPVYLIDRKNPSEGRLEAVTDSGGAYLFPEVTGGNWILRTGHPVHSTTSPQPVPVQLSAVAVDELLLPALATLEIETTDEYGRPYPGVDLVGYLRGTGNGSFRVETNEFGRAKMPYLSPGPWRVNATHAQDGRSCRLDVTLAPSEPTFQAMNMR